MANPFEPPRGPEAVDPAFDPAFYGPPPAPGSRPWTWWGSLLFVAAAYVGQIVVAVPFFIGFAAAEGAGLGILPEGWEMALVNGLAVLSVLGLLLTQRNRPGAKPLWDRRDLQDWRNWALALGALLISAGANIARIVIERDPAAPALNQDVLALINESPSTPWGPLLTLGVTVVVLAPLTEEWLFRGIVLPAIQRSAGSRRAWLGSWVAVPVSSVIFGLLHWPIWWVPAIYGAVIGGLSLRQRSLALPLLVHGAINLTVFGMLVSSA